MTRKERRAKTAMKRIEIIKCVDRIFWESMKGQKEDAAGNVQTNKAIKVVAKYVDIMIRKKPQDQELIISAATMWQKIVTAVLAEKGMSKSSLRMTPREETKGRIEG